MLDDYFAGRAAWDMSLERATGERLDELATLYGIARVDSRWRGRFSPVLIGDIVAEFRTNDLREWMTMTEEQRLDWMARALRDRRAASSEPTPSRMPRTALPSFGPWLLRWYITSTCTVFYGDGRHDRIVAEIANGDDWILYVPPGAMT